VTYDKAGAAESPLQTQQKPVRGRPFQKGVSGNPAGKPKGTRNRATLLAEALLDGQAEALAQKAVEIALTGNVSCIRFCLDRLIPPRRERTVAFTLPPITSADDALKAFAAVAAAVADGILTPREASNLSQVIAQHVHAVEVSDLELAAIIRVERQMKAPASPLGPLK
jgi:Family of unknown function (DUF5681)